MRNLAHHSPLTIGALVLGISFSPTATAADKVTYDDDVLPIFESSCLNCHNADKKKGDLDLSNFSGVMAGGAGGAARLLWRASARGYAVGAIQASQPRGR